jgi:hypothetical protein
MPRSRSTAIRSERTRRRSPRAFTSPASWIAPPNSSNFSVNEGLAGSSQRCAAAQSRKRRIASALRTDQAAAIASSTMCVIAISTATQRAARSTLNPIWRSDVKMDMSISNRRQGYDAHQNKPGRDDQIRPQNQQPGPVEGGQMPRREVGERRHSPGIAQ